MRREHGLGLGRGGVASGGTLYVRNLFYSIDCATLLKPVESCATKHKQRGRKCINIFHSWRRPVVIKRNIDDSWGLDTAGKCEE